MLPGSEFLYECPECGHKFKNQSLLSGNTFGADFFSDGRCIAVMLPEYPDFTKCGGCGKIMRLSKLSPVMEIEVSSGEWMSRETYPYAKFLNIDDYLSALDEKEFSNREDECVIRLHLLWLFNDSVRYGQIPGEQIEMPEIWSENCSRLKNLLNEETPRDIMLKAELCRNLGEFDDCIDLVNRIEDDNYNEVKKLLLSECSRKNKYVIKTD